jgi:hypothetical protein
MQGLKVCLLQHTWLGSAWIWPHAHIYVLIDTKGLRGRDLKDQFMAAIKEGCIKVVVSAESALAQAAFCPPPSPMA